MKFLFSKKQYAAVALAGLILTACSKVDKVEDLQTAQESSISFADAGSPGLKKIAIDFVNTPITLVAVQLKRNSSTEKSLNNKLTIEILDDTASVTSAGLTQLPASVYTVGNQTRNGGIGGTYEVIFEAGTSDQEIQITIPDATLLNPSLSYGLGFTIKSINGKAVVMSAKTVVVEIVAKNIYDGKYQLKGFHNRTSPLLNEHYDEEVHLITTGANSVKMYWPSLGVDAHPIHGGTTYYSNFTTEFAFNQSNNVLNKIVNTYNPAAIVFTINSSTTSRYDPATKTIYAQYYYNNNESRMFTDTLVYIGSR